MKAVSNARGFAITVASLLVAFGALAQEAQPRVDAAQNGGAAAIDMTPKYNAGLNGRVKTEPAKQRAQQAQNGGEAAAAAQVQPKYHAGLGGRPPLTLARSDAPDAAAAE